MKLMKSLKEKILKKFQLLKKLAKVKSQLIINNIDYKIIIGSLLSLLFYIVVIWMLQIDNQNYEIIYLLATGLYLIYVLFKLEFDISFIVSVAILSIILTIIFNLFNIDMLLLFLPYIHILAVKATKK